MTKGEIEAAQAEHRESFTKLVRDLVDLTKHPDAAVADAAYRAICAFCLLKANPESPNALVGVVPLIEKAVVAISTAEQPAPSNLTTH